MAERARTPGWRGTVARWWGLGVIAAAALASAAAYPRLPARFATHWSADGVPNGWSSRAVGAWLLPPVMLGLWLLFRALPALDPRRANYARFAGTYDLITNASLTLVAAVHATVLAGALGLPLSAGRLGAAAGGAFLAVLGNALPRVRPNHFVGVRTPWTLASDAVWARTHRLAGHLFTAAGVLALLGALLLPPRAAMPLFVGAVFAAALVPVVYSAFADPGDDGRGSRRAPRPTSSRPR